jgi:hypothetical protein
LLAEQGLTPWQVNNLFTLSQLSALFSTGYTWEEFGSMADANQDVLSRARKQMDAARKARRENRSQSKRQRPYHLPARGKR